MTRYRKNKAGTEGNNTGKLGIAINKRTRVNIRHLQYRPKVWAHLLEIAFSRDISIMLYFTAIPLTRFERAQKVTLGTMLK